MSNALDIDSEASLATLLTFRYGASSVSRYTSFTNPIVIGSDTWLPEPSIEASLNAQQGGTEDTAVQVRMRLRDPLDALTSQRSHSQVRADIEEVDPSDVTTRRKLFAGMVRLSDRNFSGHPGLVQLEIAGWRSMLEIAANSWLAATTCNNVLGDAVCGVDLAPLRQSATITAIDGSTITVSGLTTTAVSGYWRFGFVAYDGLQLLVREYTTGSSLQLLKIPPPSWAGKLVTLTPGCDRVLQTCRDKFDNEKRFTGFGLAIPAYNPLLESP